MHPDLQEPTPADAPPSPQPFTGSGLSRTLIALLSSCLFVHLSRPGGCKVELGLARGFLLGGLPSLEPPGPKERFGGLGFLILRRPDGLLASDLPGLPRSPQLPARLDLRRQPEGFWLRSGQALNPVAWVSAADDSVSLNLPASYQL